MVPVVVNRIRKVQEREKAKAKLKVEVKAMVWKMQVVITVAKKMILKLMLLD